MGHTSSYEQTLHEATQFLRRHSGQETPEIFVVLGSGLGDIADAMEITNEFSFAVIPGFVSPSTAGHRGRWLSGRWAGRRVIVLQGRLHFYEGLFWDEVVLPVRCATALGARVGVFTNMNGAMNPSLRPGQLVAVSDHINLMAGRGIGVTRCHGEPTGIGGWCQRPAVQPYSKRLRGLVLECAADLNIDIATGVYVGVTGPNYETPAEIRAFSRAGGDIIGMSTVGEVLEACSSGAECVAISCVANMAAGVSDQPISHADVLQTAHEASRDLLRLVSHFLSRC